MFLLGAATLPDVPHPVQSVPTVTSREYNFSFEGIMVYLVVACGALYCVILCNIEMFFLHYTGPIGTAAFYSAAAPRACPSNPPGEHLCIILVRLVLMVFVSSLIIFA